MPVASNRYRHLGRDSQHRQALLRNLVDKLFEHEQIHTTFAKAKSAQRLAERLITLGKRGKQDARARSQVQAYLYRPQLLLPKIFGEFAARYAGRAGGYTRVLKTEPKKEDMAPSAILEMVDFPGSIKFLLVARILARKRAWNLPMDSVTAVNLKKVTQGREGAVEELRELVARFERMEMSGRRLVGDEEVDAMEEQIQKKGIVGLEDDVLMPVRQAVYPDPTQKSPKDARFFNTYKRMRDDPFKERQKVKSKPEENEDDEGDEDDEDED